MTDDGSLAADGPRLLFVPVSGAFGTGEYARTLAIADAAKMRWPEVAIRFILSRQAPYATQATHPVTLLASSPTFHTQAVVEVLREWRPDVVIFDNAGRTAQLRAAQRCGARVVYVSARRRQRRKAFRLRWMRLIDEHWIAYPKFIAGSLTFTERLKRRILGRPVIRYLDVILNAAPAAAQDTIPALTGFAPQSYVLLVPGGGTGHPGATDAGKEFLGAARELAGLSNTVIVGGSDADEGTHAGSQGYRMKTLKFVPQAELATLMRGARLIVTNGGSTLVQSIACGKACVAVPIAGDQRERIERCVRAGVAIAAALDASSIVEVTAGVLRNEAQLDALAGRTIALGLTDGIGLALRALGELIAARRG